MESFLTAGRVGRPHGVKGEIAVDWRGVSDPPVGGFVYLNANGGKPAPHRILSVRSRGDRLLLGLEDVKDRSEAEKLVNCDILIRRDSLPPLGQDEVYLQDLVGCKVALPDGKLLGVLDHLEFPRGKEIWSIKDNNGREILFPARAEFMISFDEKERKISVNPPPGLLDIYSA